MKKFVSLLLALMMALSLVAPPQSGNVKAKLNIYSQNMRFW